MSFKFANAATATIAASITSSSLSVTVTAGLGALFPTLTVGQKFAAVLVDSSNNYEFITVTARTGDSMAIVRAQEGTIARSFSSGSRIELRLTSAVLNSFAQLDAVQTFSGANTFSGATAMSGGGSLAGIFTGAPEFQGSISFTGVPVFSNGLTVTNSMVGDVSSTVWLKGTNRFSGALIGSNDSYLYEPSANAFAVRTGASGSYKYSTFAANGDVSFQGNLTIGNITSSGSLSTAGSIGATGNISTAGALSSTGNISTSGNITAAGDITAFSDERLKAEWQPSREDFVDQLALLKSGSFLRTDIGKFQVGVGAQSLQSFLPLAVYQEADGYLSVNYGAAAMVSAVELAKRLVAVESRLAVLES